MGARSLPEGKAFDFAFITYYLNRNAFAVHFAAVRFVGAHHAGAAGEVFGAGGQAEWGR
jgi:hypothetical protein